MRRQHPVAQACRLRVEGTMSDEQDTAVICVGNLATAELDAIGHLELVWC